MEAKINKEAVAQNLKLIRSLTNLSMTDFGAKLGGVSKDQVASYESGRALPQEPTIIRVCQLAGISRQDLLTQKITKEGVIKEMFDVLSEIHGSSTQDSKSPQDQDEILEAHKKTIAVLERMVELQQTIIDSFGKVK